LTGCAVPPDFDTCWAAADASELLWCEIDDRAVVFNARSGETHFLNPAASEALACLAAEPATVDALAGHLEAAFEWNETEDVREHARRLIREFDDLGLVRPVPR
jgi:PqqD family protein of HPr-rel-A system